MKRKFLTFSYDDGVVQDIRLIELLNKYGMKGTFNLNSGLFGVYKEFYQWDKKVEQLRIKKEDIKYVYEGHEVAAHTVDHAVLPKLKNESEIIQQVEADRINLSELLSYEVVGMAYPGDGTGDNYNDCVSEILKEQTKIRYARTSVSSESFELPKDPYQFHATIRHAQMDQMFELGEKFIRLETDTPKLFSIWGHAYEFDVMQNWERFEEFLQMMSGRPDICYCTNKEILLG